MEQQQEQRRRLWGRWGAADDSSDPRLGRTWPKTHSPQRQRPCTVPTYAPLHATAFSPINPFVARDGIKRPPAEVCATACHERRAALKGKPAYMLSVVAASLPCRFTLTTATHTAPCMPHTSATSTVMPRKGWAPSCRHVPLRYDLQLITPSPGSGNTVCFAPTSSSTQAQATIALDAYLYGPDSTTKCAERDLIKSRAMTGTIALKELQRTRRGHMLHSASHRQQLSSF